MEWFILAIIGIVAVAVFLLRKRKTEETPFKLPEANLPTARTVRGVDYHIARFERALENPRPEKEAELRRWLAYYKALKTAEELKG